MTSTEAHKIVLGVCEQALQRGLFGSLPGVKTLIDALNELEQAATFFDQGIPEKLTTNGERLEDITGAGNAARDQK